MTSGFERAFPFVRTVVLFFGGFTGVVYETLAHRFERPVLLAVFSTMMALEAFLPSKKNSTEGSA